MGSHQVRDAHPRSSGDVKVFDGRREAERDANSEPLLSSFLYASILVHDGFDRALAFVLSNRISSEIMLPTQLYEIFHEALYCRADVLDAAFADVAAVRERVRLLTTERGTVAVLWVFRIRLAVRIAALFCTTKDFMHCRSTELPMPCGTGVLRTNCPVRRTHMSSGL